MRELFLDANAHLPLSKPALDAFIKANNSIEGHGHALAPAAPGRAAEAAIEQSREKIANLLGAEYPNQIVFTSTCTDACEWGLQIFNNINKDRKIYITPTEHPAVRMPAQDIFENRHSLGVMKHGAIDGNYPIHEESAIISIYVHNEVGYIQSSAYMDCASLFLDMSQAPGKIHFPKLSDFDKLDVAVFGAHKFAGPASMGILYIKDIDNWFGKGYGSRYFLDRAGTPDVPSIVATAAALEHAVDTLEPRMKKMTQFRDFIEPELESLGFEIIGKDYIRAPGTTFARIPDGKYSQLLMQSLSWKGIYIGLGSACGSIHSGPSPLAKILSRDGNSSSNDFIRISHYGDYDKNDAGYFIQKLKEVLS